MKISTLMMCNQAPLPMNIQTPRLMNMDLFSPMREKKIEKVVVVMGATGAGKSHLSIDLASRFPAEIINCDKIQVYEGLDIVTNKATEEEKRGVPHHLLGIANPNADFTAANFCDAAILALKLISGRSCLPIIAGGSNSYIEALVENEDYKFRSRYDCCFLWVDVSAPVLHSFVSKRVDQMIENGMVEEVRKFFDPEANYRWGIRRAIGIPELDRYLRAELSLEEAIREIKENTCKLACRQLEKIHRLGNVKGWKLHRVDATDVFRREGKEAAQAWEELVVAPSTKIVRDFLLEKLIPSSFSSNAAAAQPWKWQWRNQFYEEGVGASLYSAACRHEDSINSRTKAVEEDAINLKLPTAMRSPAFSCKVSNK
ncbi:adenylate isopentenyltransferase 3, chloroplastic [Malania oleifera]|uniref:adenylate isopentenyltransferase 3, chloroplastic n=1 Tax=Malania oleifera TaxID=397392 RepID=UPI0025ADACBD|nr:adenylate isopentenyltransferase 3, chloroplastic [Malania oleifera]XP_057964711.1 adenylate isopentenyltransferase 3, chloroplastic [Malania oleifera]